MAKDRALTGAAGEHYVAFRLATMGYAVGLTTRGTRTVDMVVANPDTGKSITVQTKTMFEDAFVQSKKWGAYWKWRVGTRRAEPYPTFFYAFVDLKGNLSRTPDVFIVPSIELLPLLSEWSDKKSGRVTDVWCDIYEVDAPKYQNRWDIIKAALE